MKWVGDTLALYVRLVRQTLRMPVFALITVVQSILWLVLFGQLFGAVAQIPGFGGASYTQFLAPGITIMTALFGSAYAGMGLIIDMDRGILDRMLATPVSRTSLVAARVLHAGSQVVAQGATILVAAILLGARPQSGAIGFVAVLLAAGMLGGAFGAVSSAMALVTRRQESLIAAINFLALPMAFLSGILMSPSLMPAWIRRAAALNPVNWAVTAARAAFEGRDWGAAGLSLLWLTLFALAAAWLATRAFERYRATL